MVLEDGTSSPDRLGAGHEGRYQVLSAEVQEHLPPLDGEYQGLVYQRQLWWGHRIPAYFLPEGGYVVAETEEKALELAKEKMW